MDEKDRKAIIKKINTKNTEDNSIWMFWIWNDNMKTYHKKMN